MVGHIVDLKGIKYETNGQNIITDWELFDHGMVTKAGEN
jgi:hypothetical protein